MRALRERTEPAALVDGPHGVRRRIRSISIARSQRVRVTTRLHPGAHEIPRENPRL